MIISNQMQTMTIIDDLPYEILEVIIKKAINGTKYILYKLLLVCRKFYTIISQYCLSNGCKLVNGKYNRYSPENYIYILGHYKIYEINLGIRNILNIVEDIQICATGLDTTIINCAHCDRAPYELSIDHKLNGSPTRGGTNLVRFMQFHSKYEPIFYQFCCNSFGYATARAYELIMRYTKDIKILIYLGLYDSVKVGVLRYDQ